MKKTCILIPLTLFFMETQAQLTYPLYEGAAPNSKHYTTEEKWEPQDNGDTIVHFISEPTITAFLPKPENANGTAVIICPGGGYWVNSMIKEGYDVARKFNEWGVAAFVLKYRIPNDSSMTDKKFGPLMDAQSAIKSVRMHAKMWGLDTNKVGIMGFSAGGHLASTLATHFEKDVTSNRDDVSIRPDFAILVYPVISFQDNIGHIGSRDQLIGKKPSKKWVDYFSNELQVTEKTPPSFLVHAGDDDAVPVMNSIAFYEALLKYKIPAELHIYKSGGHGFGMHNPTTKDEWMERCRTWMQAMKWLDK